jgi:hypothetical protein
MKKIFFASLLVLTFTTLSAQQIYNDFNLFWKTDEGNSIADKNFGGFNFDYSLNSNAVTNNFLLEYAREGFIDDDLKNETGRRLKAENRYGYQLFTSLSGKSAINEKVSIYAGLSARQINAAKFSDDMFNLIFRGNKMFAGEYADLYPFRYFSTDFQSLTIGLEKKCLNNKLRIWGGLSGVRGGHFRSATVYKGSLYTEPDGSYVETDINFRADITQGKPGLFGDYNGAGASLNGGATFESGKSMFAFSVTDLGFVKWNNVKVYSGNSIYRFEGKEINNLFSIDDSSFTSFDTDSVIKDAGIKVETDDVTSLLPAILKINYIYYHSPKIFLITGAQYILKTSSLPRVYIRPVLKLNKNFYFHLEAAGGGFGRVDAEIGVSALVKNTLGVNLNLFAAELIFAKSRTSGHGISFSLFKSF